MEISPAVHERSQIRRQPNIIFLAGTLARSQPSSVNRLYLSNGRADGDEILRKHGALICQHAHQISWKYLQPFMSAVKYTGNRTSFFSLEHWPEASRAPSIAYICPTAGQIATKFYGNTGR
jgi:hypothetical protein